MGLGAILIQLAIIGIAIAFPFIWKWISKNAPWWPVDPQSTLNLITFIVVLILSWLFGLWGIMNLVKTLKLI